MSKTVYKIYNPMANEYVDVSTITEAKTRKQSLVNDFLKQKLEDANGQFSITAVNTDENGNEVWSEVAINSYQIIDSPFHV